MQISEDHKLKSLSQRIDFLRGVFSLWVLFAHTYYCYISVDPSLHSEGWFETLFQSGYLGVTGFFFLSGFCIQWSITKTLLASDGKKFNYLAYLKARFTRLAPLFYIGLVNAIVVEWICANFLTRSAISEIVTNPALAVGASLVFLQGLIATYGSYSPSWSITNEVFYYIAWPAALIMMRRNVLRSFIVSAFIAIILTVGFYSLWKISGFPIEIFRISLWTIPLCSLMWFMGALCKHYHGVITCNSVYLILDKWRWPIVILWIIWANTLAYLELSLIARIILNPFSYIIVPLLVLANWRVPTNPESTRWFADVSYPLYLFHGPILALVSSIIFTFHPSTPALWTALVSGASALAISGTIGVWLERRFMKIRLKFT